MLLFTPPRVTPQYQISLNHIAHRPTYDRSLPCAVRIETLRCFRPTSKLVCGTNTTTNTVQGSTFVDNWYMFTAAHSESFRTYTFNLLSAPSGVNMYVTPDS